MANELKWEWKDIDKERPEIGTKCIVSDLHGNMSIKMYCRYNISKITRGGGIDVHVSDDACEGEGFVSRSASLDQTAAFWIELPKLPERYEKATKIKAKIAELQKELESLRSEEPYIEHFERG